MNDFVAANSLCLFRDTWIHCGFFLHSEINSNFNKFWLNAAKKWNWNRPSSTLDKNVPTSADWRYKSCALIHFQNWLNLENVLKYFYFREKFEKNSTIYINVVFAAPVRLYIGIVIWIVVMLLCWRWMSTKKTTKSRTSPVYLMEIWFEK